MNLKKEYSGRINALFAELKQTIKDMPVTKKNKNRLEAAKEILDAGFAFEEEIEKSAVIWVGIGCAFNNKNKKDSSAGKEDHLRDGLGIFLDKDHKDGFDYYKAIEKFLVNELHIEKYTTLDLCCLRETNQKILESYFKNEFKDFFNKSVELFLEILHKAKPKMVIIGNAYVSRILGEKLSLSLDDERLCWLCPEFDNVPFFKSSMISGRRPLDNGSKELLGSVIKRNLQIVNKMTKQEIKPIK